MSADAPRGTTPAERPPLLATEKQREALIRWGVDRELASDPGLPRSDASRWLAALIAQKGRNGDRSERAGDPREADAAAGWSVGTPPGKTRVPATPMAETPPWEPQGLEIELTAPTGIPYSTVRVRASASRRPGESLTGLGDRLLDEVTEVVRREARRAEASLNRPSGEAACGSDKGHRTDLERG